MFVKKMYAIKLKAKIKDFDFTVFSDSSPLLMTFGGVWHKIIFYNFIKLNLNLCPKVAHATENYPEHSLISILVILRY